MWSKIKEVIGMKPIETLKDFEADLIKLKEKTNCSYTALIGTGGRLKGLPLIYATDDENLLKRYTAKLCELVEPLKNLSNQDKLREFRIYYEDTIVIFKPIANDIDFIAAVKNSDYVQYIAQWIYKKQSDLKNIFENKQE